MTRPALEVMDSAIDALFTEGGSCDAYSLRDARQRIAELIERADDVNGWLIRSGLEGTAHQIGLRAALAAVRGDA